MTLVLRPAASPLTLSCNPDGGLTIYGPTPFQFTPEDTAKLRDYLIEKTAE